MKKFFIFFVAYCSIIFAPYLASADIVSATSMLYRCSFWEEEIDCTSYFKFRIPQLDLPGFSKYESEHECVQLGKEVGYYRVGGSFCRISLIEPIVLCFIIAFSFLGLKKIRKKNRRENDNFT